MGKSLVVPLTILLLISCCLTAISAEAPQDEKKSTVVVGKVVNQDGKPIPGAKVLALIYKRPDKPGPRMAETEVLYADKNGRFRYTPDYEPLYGYYAFAAVAERYTANTGSRKADEDTEIEIVLRPEQKVRGIVVDENGDPLAGVKVRVNRCYGNRMNSDVHVSFPGNVPGIGETITAGDGSFLLLHLPDYDDYDWFDLTLQASKKGRATVCKEFRKTANSGDALVDVLEMTQPPECFVEGTLSLPGKAGPAPEGTRVVVRVPPEFGWDPRVAEVDKSGRFRIAELPPCKATVTLGPPKYEYGPDNKPIPPKEHEWTLPAVTDLELKPEIVAKLDLVLTPGAVIKGKVVNKETGKPAKARLTVKHPGGPTESLYGRVSTNEEGEFTTRVAAGEITVSVEGIENTWFQPDRRPSESFTIADGEEKSDVTLEVSPTSDESSDHQAMMNPVPPDFELKPGTYQLTWDAGMDCRYAIHSRTEKVGKDVSDKLKGAPKFVSENVKYRAVQFDGPDDEGFLVMALDESKGTGKGYDRLYVDLNRNWDLSDDNPVSFSVLEEHRQFSTDCLTVPAHQGPPGAERAANPVQFSVEIYRYPGDVRFGPRRKSGWKGTIETNKGPVECAIVDGNSNGIYGEPMKWKDDFEPEAFGDGIYIDCNGAGKVMPYGYGNCNHNIRLNPITRVGDKFYSIKVSEVGNTVTIEPYAGEMGTLLVRGGFVQGRSTVATEVYVVSKNGDYSFVNLADSAVSLPAGSYKVRGCKLGFDKKDSQNKFIVGGYLNEIAEIKPGEKSSIYIAGRISLEINASEKDLVWERGKPNNLNWNVGIGGKMTLYSLDDERRPPPSVRFIDKTGKVVATVSAGST